VSVKNLSWPGLVYVGENLPDLSGGHNDACLINPTLPIAAAEPWQGGEEMDYWPRYDRLTPKGRGAYLKWLAAGRSDRKACMGYVFLFCYGLERRLFHDGMNRSVSEKERAAIVDEVRRLLAIYGENRSFKGYATNFLAMEWGLFQPRADIPDYLSPAHSFSADPFQIQLARSVAAQKPLPAVMALQWPRFHPDFGLRTPARRCPQEFKELFARRYAEKFGDGLLVPLNKKKLSISYRAANPSLRGLRLDFAELPDPFNLTSPLKKIFEVSESCAAELEAYSRYLGRKGSDSASLAALALLPKDLAAPAAEKIRGLLGRIAADGPGLVETKTLFEIMGQPLPGRIERKDAENLAVLVEKLGFGLVPDVRYHGIKPDKNAQVAVFPRGHGPGFTPSPEFRLVGAMLRLGALVSQSDGKVSPPEESLLKSLVQDDRELNGAEKGALLAYLHWRLYTPQETAGLKQKVSELDSACRELVGRILISVAHADGRIDPNEVKQREKLYPALGLDKARVAGDLHAMAGAAAPAEAARPEPAPPRPPQTAGSAFSLNDELIRLRERETQEVRNVLENIFTEQPEKASPDEPLETPEENPLAGLDRPYRKLLMRLMEREHWERPAVHGICLELRLMLDGALEVLNEWAFANANAPLIEDGDPIHVDLELAKELANA
jgi:tellurite resistance protein